MSSPLTEMKKIVDSSVEHGLKVPAVRATMLAGFFSGGVGIYVFYALQPYLLQPVGKSTCLRHRRPGRGDQRWRLDRRRSAHAERIRGAFRRRTSALLITTSISVLMLLVIGLIGNFWMVVAAITISGLAESASRPIRQAYLNGMIPSQQRATILSFDSLIDNAGGIVAQPALGKSADVWGYQASYLLSAAGTALALPFIARARQLNTPADERDGATPRNAADQLSQGDRYVTPTARARATSSHRGSPAALELRTGREQHPAGTLAGSDEQLAIIIST